MTQQEEVAQRIAQLRREKSAREQRDVLQGEIADAIGISSETYSRYENGKRKVPREVVLALAAYFGTTPHFIDYGITPEMTIAGHTVTHKRTFTEEELAEATRIVAERDAARAKREEPPPRPRKRGNDH